VLFTELWRSLTETFPVPLAPWNTDKSWGDVSVPTLIIGGSADTVAPVSSHSIPFYTSLGSSEKSYVELAGASHFFPQTANSTVNRYMVS
jgi:alpha-beta hydrolase superfamily lysophospholipase